MNTMARQAAKTIWAIFTRSLLTHPNWDLPCVRAPNTLSAQFARTAANTTSFPCSRVTCKKAFCSRKMPTSDPSTLRKAWQTRIHPIQIGINQSLLQLNILYWRDSSRFWLEHQAIQKKRGKMCVDVGRRGGGALQDQQLLHILWKWQQPVSQQGCLLS